MIMTDLFAGKDDLQGRLPCSVRANLGCMVSFLEGDFLLDEDG